jgi:hypothetical protein
VGINAVLVLLAALAAPRAQAAAPASPAWDVQSIPMPTNFIPGEEGGEDTYQLFLVNSGAKATDGSPITITDTLPKGIGVKGLELRAPRGANPTIPAGGCEAPATVGEVTTVSCEVTNALLPKVEPARLEPGEGLLLRIETTVPPTASGTLVNRVEVKGGGAATVSAEAENQAGVEDAEAGFQEFKAELTGPDGLPVSAADSHPYQYTTSFAVNTITTKPGAGRPLIAAGGNLREIEVALPPGLAGNPTATERCTAQQFADTFTAAGNVFANRCSTGSAIGLVMVQQLEGGPGVTVTPLYNLVPPRGMPAQFGFLVTGAPIYINTRVRSDGDYGVSAYLENVTEANRVTASRVTIWGTPWDESHDSQRGLCGAAHQGSCPAEGTPRPFLRLPSSCANPLLATMGFETWAQPSASAATDFEEAPPVGCDAPPFTPTITAKPTTNVADSPSGLHVDLHLPQAQNEDPEGLAEADLEDATVTLPEGLNVNPSSADGLRGCSLAQIGYQGVKEGKPSFSAAPAECPEASKIGTVEIETPLLDHPLPGAVYLARQSENPFGSLLAIYIAVFDPESGVVVKLPGKVTPDPVTGQLSTTVAQGPQLPFEDFKLDFFEGARAPLRTPATCGTFTTTTQMAPWTAPAGATATPTDSFQTSVAPGGGACPGAVAALPNSPSFEAGTASPIAGSYSPFLLRLARRDGSQELGGLNLTLPPGLIGKLTGVAECSEAQIAQAKSRGKPGDGALEQASPSCPAGSELGTVTVGAGAGPNPVYVQGHAYLAGPYKGAPLSMAIVTPALAGPFDLGVVVVRAALQVNPTSAQITAVSDPIPAILAGIPLDVRSIAVKLDRPGFTLNPTSCEAMAITGQAIALSGQGAALSNRFQVGGCQNLKFAPKLALSLKGGTKRNRFPALKAVLTYPKGNYANIAKAQVTLPHSEFLEQGHFGTVCTQPQLKTQTCPKASVYGKATAVTPLLDKPLTGPVYLAVGFGHELPDLVADLDGQIRVVLNGKVDTGKGGGIRNTFLTVPDAPVSKFTLELFGGKKGLIVNSENICGPRAKTKAIADFTAQNGKVYNTTPTIANSCKGGKKKHSKRRHRSR